MEPEQEALSIVSFKDWEAASPVNKLNPNLIKSQLRRFYLVSESGIGYRLDRIVDSLSTSSKVTGGKDGVDHT